METRLGNRQTSHVGPSAEHSNLKIAVVAVVGCHRIEIAHVRATEGDTCNCFRWDFDAPVDRTVALESDQFARTTYDRSPYSALRVDSQTIGHSFGQACKQAAITDG